MASLKFHTFLALFCGAAIAFVCLSTTGTTMLTYTKGDLLSLRQPRCRLSSDIYSVIRSLNICAVKRTRRGRRRGRKDNELASLSKKGSNLHFGLWNIRSIKAENKVTSLCNLIIDQHMDAMAITETWLKGDDSDDCILADLHTSLPDFAFYHCPRNKGKGGGVGFLIRKSFDVKLNDSGNLRSFEFIDLNISSSKSTIRMIGLYRPPPNNKNKLTFAMFIDDFSSLLQILSSSTTHLNYHGGFEYSC